MEITLAYSCGTNTKTANYFAKRFITKDGKIRNSELSEIAIYLPLACAVKKGGISGVRGRRGGWFNASKFNLEALSSGGH